MGDVGCVVLGLLISVVGLEIWLVSSKFDQLFSDQVPWQMSTT